MLTLGGISNVVGRKRVLLFGLVWWCTWWAGYIYTEPYIQALEIDGSAVLIQHSWGLGNYL